MSNLGDSIVISYCHFTTFVVTTAKPVVALVCSNQPSGTIWATKLLIDFGRGLAVEIIQRGLALGESSATPEGSQLALQRAQWFSATRTIVDFFRAWWIVCSAHGQSPYTCSEGSWFQVSIICRIASSRASFSESLPIEIRSLSCSRGWSK